MKNLYCFEINKMTALDEAWMALEQAGVEIAYGSEDDTTGKQIYGYWHAKQPLPRISCVLSSHLAELPSIDWEAQWAEHGWNFQDGCINVDLSEFGYKNHSLLRLKPGPGFGDLSHPTTRLMLHVMSPTIQQSSVIDIGCGSGILTLAAIAMGASMAYGIDIDPEAIAHAYANAKLNGMEDQCQFYLPQDFNISIQQPIVIVMNMISSEQKVAWESLPQLHHLAGMRITSGIREEERSTYLEQAHQWGWRLIEERQEGEWLAFVFITHKG